MLYKTQGIVLHSLPYKDVYTILHIYKKTSGGFHIWWRANGGKGLRCRRLCSCRFRWWIWKSSIRTNGYPAHQGSVSGFFGFVLSVGSGQERAGSFLSEVLFRVVKDTQPDERMYAFLTDSVRILDSVEQGLANFHVAFLLNLLHYLGIFPNVEHPRDALYFDMLNGIFVCQHRRILIICSRQKRWCSSVC